MLKPKHPERTCWGCEKLCPAESLACGNGTIRAPHPAELFGEDWLEWIDERAETRQPSASPARPTSVTTQAASAIQTKT